MTLDLVESQIRTEIASSLGLKELSVGRVKVDVHAATAGVAACSGGQELTSYWIAFCVTTRASIPRFVAHVSFETASHIVFNTSVQSMQPVVTRHQGETALERCLRSLDLTLDETSGPTELGSNKTQMCRLVLRNWLHFVKLDVLGSAACADSPVVEAFKDTFRSLGYFGPFTESE